MSTGWSGFLARGGRWVLAQLALMTAVAVLGPWGQGSWSRSSASLPAIALLLVGGFCGIAGVWVLGRNRTIFPKPHADSALITHGIYSWMRHPLYTSVMLLSIGWSLWWASGWALGASAALALLLNAKARREEVWLREQFPGYADYQRRVKRFLPWVF